MSASSETWQFEGQSIQVSHLEKRYWPQAEVTKGEMLHYYRQIAPHMLPHFKDRPVTLRPRDAQRVVEGSERRGK